MLAPCSRAGNPVNMVELLVVAMLDAMVMSAGGARDADVEGGIGTRAGGIGTVEALLLGETDWPPTISDSTFCCLEDMGA
jgi:hypothetical protein